MHKGLRGEMSCHKPCWYGVHSGRIPDAPPAAPRAPSSASKEHLTYNYKAPYESVQPDGENPAE
jgi:hypothetical protein